MDQPLQDVWRREIGGVAWPTVALAALVVPGWAAVVALHHGGQLSGLVAMLFNAALAYLAFTPMHEAAHGNVGGARDRAWLDRVVGWACAAVLLAPFPLFRRLHLQHHAHTNKPERDPDWHVHGRGVLLLLRAATVYPAYVRAALGRLGPGDPGRARRPGELMAFVGIWVLLAIAALAGAWSTVVFAVVLPAWAALLVLALVFDWLPHARHHSVGRYVDTRCTPHPVLHVLALGQDVHGVHHLWPRVPWYRYGAVYREVHPELTARGMRTVPLAEAVRDAL